MDSAVYGSNKLLNPKPDKITDETVCENIANLIYNSYQIIYYMHLKFLDFKLTMPLLFF